MGVSGLWTLLEPVGRRVNIETLTNKRLAIGECCVCPCTHTFGTLECLEDAWQQQDRLICRCINMAAPVLGGYARPAGRGHPQRPPAGLLPAHLQASAAASETLPSTAALKASLKEMPLHAVQVAFPPRAPRICLRRQHPSAQAAHDCCPAQVRSRAALLRLTRPLLAD